MKNKNKTIITIIIIITITIDNNGLKMVLVNNPPFHQLIHKKISNDH
jgi:hypothetical protein